MVGARHVVLEAINSMLCVEAHIALAIRFFSFRVHRLVVHRPSMSFFDSLTSAGMLCVCVCVVCVCGGCLGLLFLAV